MTNYITWLFNLKLDRWICWYFCAICFMLCWTNHILIVMWDLYFIYCFCVLYSVVLFPLPFFLPKAKHNIIASTCKNIFPILTNCNKSTEFFMLSKAPILIRFISFHKLVLKLVKVDLIFFFCLWSLFPFLILRHSLFLLLVFLVLFHLFFFWIDFHSFYNVIVDYPYIILI